MLHIRTRDEQQNSKLVVDNLAIESMCLKDPQTLSYPLPVIPKQHIDESSIQSCSVLISECLLMFHLVHSPGIGLRSTYPLCAHNFGVSHWRFRVALSSGACSASHENSAGLASNSATLLATGAAASASSEPSQSFLPACSIESLVLKSLIQWSNWLEVCLEDSQRLKLWISISKNLMKTIWFSETFQINKTSMNHIELVYCTSA